MITKDDFTRAMEKVLKKEDEESEISDPIFKAFINIDKIIFAERIKDELFGKNGGAS